MFKKIKNFNNWLIVILCPLSVLIFLIVIIIRPLLLIRFGEILIYRFGHSLINVEIFLQNKKLEKNNSFFPKKLDIFFFSSVSSNKFLKTICKRCVLTMPFQLVLTIFNTLGWLSSFNNFFKKHLIIIRNYDMDQNNLFDKTDHILNFTKNEIKKGDNFLEKLGIDKKDKFVCLYNRESDYLRKYLSDPYENNSRWNLRNSDIETYKLAAEELVKLGYKVVRVGKYTKKKITFSNPNIIDYSNSVHTSDFLDVYLSYKCKFVLGDSAGWSAMPILFRKHIAFANIAPYGILLYYTKKNTFIFKKYYSLDKKKILSLKEIKDTDIINAFSDDLKNKNIRLIDNTPEEIRDLAIEVEEKYKGKTNANESYIDEQKKFKNYIKKNFFLNSKYACEYEFESSCGTNFLKTIRFS